MQTTGKENKAQGHWEEIAPLLDDAMLGLGKKDRDAIVLRFFEKKSFKEIGQALGANEDSAQKRVSRALQKLQSFFSGRGVLIPGLALGTVISSHAVHAAPAGTISSIMRLCADAWEITASKTRALLTLFTRRTARFPSRRFTTVCTVV